MRKTRRTITASRVADLLERYLEPHQPKGYRIVVDRTGVSMDSEGWWHVPISPSKASAPSYDWIGRSAEAAVDLDEAEGVHVLLT